MRNGKIVKLLGAGSVVALAGVLVLASGGLTPSTGAANLQKGEASGPELRRTTTFGTLGIVDGQTLRIEPNPVIAGPLCSRYEIPDNPPKDGCTLCSLPSANWPSGRTTWFVHHSRKIARASASLQSGKPSLMIEAYRALGVIAVFVTLSVVR
jgi:hypothetical protein